MEIRHMKTAKNVAYVYEDVSLLIDSVTRNLLFETMSTHVSLITDSITTLC